MSVRQQAEEAAELLFLIRSDPCNPLLWEEARSSPMLRGADAAVWVLTLERLTVRPPPMPYACQQTAPEWLKTCQRQLRCILDRLRQEIDEWTWTHEENPHRPAPMELPGRGKRRRSILDAVSAPGGKRPLVSPIWPSIPPSRPATGPSLLVPPETTSRPSTVPPSRPATAPSLIVPPETTPRPSTVPSSVAPPEITPRPSTVPSSVAPPGILPSTAPPRVATPPPFVEPLPGTQEYFRRHWILLECDRRDGSIHQIQTLYLTRMLKFFWRRARIERAGMRALANPTDDSLITNTAWFFFEDTPDRVFVNSEVVTLLFRTCTVANNRSNPAEIRQVDDIRNRCLGDRKLQASVFVILFEDRILYVLKSYLSSAKFYNSKNAINLVQGVACTQFKPWRFYSASPRASRTMELKNQYPQEFDSDAACLLINNRMADRIVVGNATPDTNWYSLNSEAPGTEDIDIFDSFDLTGTAIGFASAHAPPGSQ